MRMYRESASGKGRKREERSKHPLCFKINGVSPQGKPRSPQGDVPRPQRSVINRVGSRHKGFASPRGAPFKKQSRGQV